MERGAKSHGLRPVKNCRANLNGCLRVVGSGLNYTEREQGGGQGMRWIFSRC